MLLAGSCLATLLHAHPAWCGWQTFGIADGLPAPHVTSIAEDSSENLWFGTSFGVSRYDGANFRNFGVPDGNITSSNFLNQWGTDGGNRRIVVGMRYVF